MTGRNTYFSEDILNKQAKKFNRHLFCRTNTRHKQEDCEASACTIINTQAQLLANYQLQKLSIAAEIP